MESQLTVWLHLLAFAVYAGATAFVLVVAASAGRTADPEARGRLMAATLRIYDPLSLAALGVAIMTGAFQLTAYKDALRGAFFERLGAALGWKLLLTFILINLAAYIAFGLGHRLVRTIDAGEALEAARLDAMTRRLAISTALALALVGMIVWVALRMATPLLPAPVG